VISWIRQFVATPLLLFGSKRSTNSLLGLTEEEVDMCQKYVDDKYEGDYDEF
jgi:hypothetical protein